MTIACECAGVPAATEAAADGHNKAPFLFATGGGTGSIEGVTSRRAFSGRHEAHQDARAAQ